MPSRPRTRGRRLRQVFLGVLGMLALVVLVAVVDGWRAFGRGARGVRRARMQRSPQWRDGHFENPEPLRNDVWGSLVGARHASPDTSPSAPVAAAAPDLRSPPPSGLRVTWLGHSTTLVEIDGRRVLTDPVWSTRVSPVDLVGPKRWYPPPIALEDLPAIDAVVVSHDHYDHLDRPTVERLRDRASVFVVPLGVGAHLAYWGIPENRIVELDWWEETRLGDDLRIACMPARHASGRTVFDKDATLWAGWALVSAKHRVYYSGDTGLFPAMREIGVRFGPFDVTMIETGQYHPSWPDWHIGPEQAVVAHRLVRGRVMLPVHWGALALAYHTWTEPIERALAAGDAAGVTLVAPRPGQSFEPASPPRVEPWWPKVPGRSGAEDPIVSTQIPDALRAR